VASSERTVEETLNGLIGAFEDAIGKMGGRLIQLSVLRNVLDVFRRNGERMKTWKAVAALTNIQKLKHRLVHEREASSFKLQPLSSQISIAYVTSLRPFPIQLGEFWKS